MGHAQHRQLSQQQRYNGSNHNKVPICELSPAQTLKHMAEQHQHKSTVGIQFTRSPLHQHSPHQKQMNINRPTPNGGNQFPNDFHKFNVNEFINSPVLGGPAGMDNDMMYAHHQHQHQKNQQQFKKQHYPQYNDGASATDSILSTAHAQPRNNALSASQQHPLGLRGNIDQFVSDEQANVNGAADMDGNKNDNRNNSQLTALQLKQGQQLNIIQQGANPHNIHVS